LSKATKVLVVHLYAVQRAVPARKHTNQKNQKTTENKQKKTQQQQNQNKNTEKWDRNQQWELHA